MLALDCAYSHRRSHAFGPCRGVIPARRELVDHPRTTWAQCTPHPGLLKTEIGMFRSDSGLPGQFPLTRRYGLVPAATRGRQAAAACQGFGLLNGLAADVHFRLSVVH
jgi:hypothetical protein